ncbi:MAG: DNA translocase FtsK [Myxococcales bacterium]|nr:DNA translocase FtsK [Myxococcales bacterium]
MPPRRKASDEDLGTFGEDEDDLTPEPRAVVRRARKLVAAAPVVERKDAIDEVVSKPIRPGPPPPILYDKPAPRPDYARGRELGALLFFAAAVFVALGLGSYDLRGGADWVGPVGARTAQILVSAVGLAAWAIPVELVLFALPFLRGRPSVITPARAAGDVVLGAVGAALLHVGSLGKIVFGGHTAGGTIGELFGELLRALFSTVGTFLVGLTMIALMLIARATFSFIDFANRTGATSAAVATRAASTVRGVREAWQEAKLLEGGPGAPLVLAGGDFPAERLSFAPPSESVELGEIKVREDSRLPPEAHAIALRLAADPPRASNHGDAIAPPIVLAGPPVPPPPAADALEALLPPVAEEKPRRKKKTADAPTIAPPSPEAAVQREEEVPAEALVAETPTPSEPIEESSEVETAEVVEVDEAEEETPAEAPRRRKQIIPWKRGFELPSPTLLDPAPEDQPQIDRELLLADARALVQTLQTYKVVGEVREIHPGPVVTTYELEPRVGTKVREVEGLANDLRLSLAKESVRIVAPIPGKNRIGFELPNAQRIPVNFRELVEDKRFAEAKGALPVILGRDIVGAPVYEDLAAMPHLLVAGATGAGKSVGLNVIVASLLHRRTPEDLRLIMVDPKVVELAPFDRIPHMLLPVVTDMKQALNALKWCVDEMERRYQLLAKAGVKNITTYNLWRDKIVAGTLKNPMPRTVVATDHNGLPEEIVTKDPNVGEQQLPEKLPYLVVIVDEFADLMMAVGKGEVEPPIARLAQKARAAGIHVILATQRPSVDVITGMIKANFPTRIAFRVAQRVDSRTILDAQGAEYLLGKGDMLASVNGKQGLKRIQCPFVSEEEIQKICDFLRAQGEPVFDESILLNREEDGDDDGEEEALSPKDQELFDRAVELVVEARKCSTSWLQRKMGLGYNKAARFVDRMERTGVVGPAVGAGKDREVLQ